MEVVADAEAAARRGAELIASEAAAAIADRGRFTLAVSGGRGPWRMFELLAEHELDWNEIAIFQVDERVAPDDDPDRNLTHLEESLPSPALSSLRPMPVGDADLDEAAKAYAATLPETIDLVHLGLGPDGHTASLIPGDPVLEVTDRTVAATGSYQGRRRVTLTYPAIDAARKVFWHVTGEDKQDALEKLLAGDESIPAGRVRTADQILIADRAAAG